jgi:hypothetical protein
MSPTTVTKGALGEQWNVCPHVPRRRHDHAPIAPDAPESTRKHPQYSARRNEKVRGSSPLSSSIEETNGRPPGSALVLASLTKPNSVPLEQGSDRRPMDTEPSSQILDRRRLLFILLDQLCDFCQAEAAMTLPRLLASLSGLSCCSGRALQRTQASCLRLLF